MIFVFSDNIVILALSKFSSLGKIVALNTKGNFYALSDKAVLDSRQAFAWSPVMSFDSGMKGTALFILLFLNLFTMSESSPAPQENNSTLDATCFQLQPDTNNLQNG